MSDKKHIDRLFQEKLKDFEATPDKAVWNKISDQLNEKKGIRKVIPIWWKLAGVAAGLILLLTVGNLVFKYSSSSNKVVGTENTDSNSNSKKEDKNYQKENIVTDTNNKKTGADNNLSTDETIINNEEIILPKLSDKNNGVANLKESSSQKNKVKSKINQNNYQNKKTTNSTNYFVNTQKNEFQKSNKLSEQPANVINNTIKNSSINQDSKKEVLVEHNEKKSTEIKKNRLKNNINNKEDRLVLDDKKEKSQLAPEVILNKDDAKDKKEQLVFNDEKEKTPLTEELIANNETIIEEEKETINRWQVNPNIAPVYFNSFGDGSTINEQLNYNKKNGKINMSYGINVSYAVNNKLSIKSGVNRVDLGYSTNDILIYENVGETNQGTSLLRNIKLNNGLQSLSFVSGNNFSFAQSPSIIPGESLAKLNQDMSYYEIPLEIKYKLSQNKLGFSLVGGFSTLILSDNSVSFELRGVNTTLGEAKNLNNTSFSANIGFGLDYAIFKNVNFNLDPMFKYQINTFNDTSGNFKPYFIGVYTGLNYKF